MVSRFVASRSCSRPSSFLAGSSSGCSANSGASVPPNGRRRQRRFAGCRLTITANREALAKMTPYHARVRDGLRAHFEAPDNGKSFAVKVDMGIGPVFFQRTAWDMTQATGAIAHIDPELAFALSAAYGTQQDYTTLQAAVLQGTIQGRSWRQDFDGCWQSI